MNRPWGHFVPRLGYPMRDVPKMVARSVLWRTGRLRNLEVVQDKLQPGDWTVALWHDRALRMWVPVAAVRHGAQIPKHIESAGFSPAGSRTQHQLRSEGLVIENSSQRNGFGADVWLMRHSGTHLLFNTRKQRVVRVWAKPASDEYADLREAFSRQVASPNFQLGSGRMFVEEELVQGSLFSELSSDRKDEVCRTILLRLVGLSLHESESIDSGVQQKIFKKSPIFEARARIKELIELFGEDLRFSVPVHGELWRGNIVISQGEQPVACDFDTIYRGLFWVDAVGIANDAIETWCLGGFDDELGLLWETAGLRPVKWNHDRVRLALLARTAVDADRRLRSIGRPWRPMKRFLAGQKARAAWSLRSANFARRD